MPHAASGGRGIVQRREGENIDSGHGYWIYSTQLAGLPKWPVGVIPRRLLSPSGVVYILYLDESGTQGDEASYFVLAGLAVFEREIHWYARELNTLQAEFLPLHSEPIHFHATTLRARAGTNLEEPWTQITYEDRLTIKNRVYDTLRSRQGVLFGCAIEKVYANQRGEDPYERAFEDIVSRFDKFIGRKNQQATSEGRDEQRGLIVLAESKFEPTIATLARRLQTNGTRWGFLHNVTDIPYFAPARATRLLQFADFCSNAIYGRYHSGLTGDFDKIAPKFDMDGGIMHGLAHLSLDDQCMCPACMSRRTPPLHRPTPSIGLDQPAASPHNRT